jgi:hypothetical protein
MNKKILILLVILLTGSLFITGQAFAAWTQGKGHAYNQLTYSYYYSKHKFSTIEESSKGDPKKIEQPRYIDYKLTYYGEYGITDQFTVFLTVPYAWVESEDVLKFAAERGPSGTGDINLGFRQKLSDNLFGTGILMSFQGTLKIPEAYEYENPFTHQSLGDGQYDGIAAIVFGKGIGKGYVVVNTGYKYRFEQIDWHFKPSDQFTLRIDAGYGIIPKLSLRGNLEWAKSFGNASISQSIRDANVKTGGSYGEDEKIIKDSLTLEPDTINVGLALAYSITSQIGAVISYNTVISGIGDGIFSSKDTGQGDSYGVAVTYSF